MTNWRIAVPMAFLAGMTATALAEPMSVTDPGAKQEAERLDKLPAVSPSPSGHSDDSGRKVKGGASYYAHRFANRKMADGHRMNPNSNQAASKNLPLGSVAKVTNLENGKTATVKIEDRGPYARGRIVDLAPAVAAQLQMKEKGVVPVEVKPITLPQPDGGVKLGAGAGEATPQEVGQAVEMTKQLTGPKEPESSEN